MREILRLGGTLMLYSLTVGVALAFVNIKTEPVIVANRLAAEEAARAEVLPGMRGGFEELTASDGFTYWAGFADEARSTVGGYVFIARGTGYSSTIQTMVAVDPDGAVAGVKVLFQQETPGLGTKAVEVAKGDREPWFTAQFRGLHAGDVRLTKEGGRIDAITGATVTSNAITRSVHADLEQLHAIVEGQL